jgi:hypothetical protein
MEPSDTILDLIASGERVLFLAEDVVWEAHLQSCLAGTIVAAARPLGAERPFGEERFELSEITELAPYEPQAGEEPDTELSKMATDMAAQAAEYQGLSLAERLIRDHIRREEDDDGRNHRSHGTRRG